MHAALLAVLFLAADDAVGSVYGVVTGSDQDPLAGVSVIIGERRQNPDSIVKTTTDDAGRFAIALPRTSEGPAERIYMLVAHKPGWTVSGALIQGATPSSEPLRIALQRPQPVSVRVVDPQGSPVARAKVALGYLQQGDASFFGEILGELLSWETDAEGQVSLSALPATAAFGLVATTTSYGRQQLYFPAERTEHTFPLRSTGELIGRVTAEDPAAVRNLEVSIESRVERRPGDAAAVAIGQASLRTDAEGRFEVSALAEGEAHVTVAINQQLPFRMGERNSVVVRSGETTTITIPLYRGTLVRGGVVNADTQQPLRGVRLDVWKETGEQPQFVTTDHSGAFEARVGPGQFWVRMREIPRNYLWPVVDSQAGTIEAGTETIELAAFQLRPGGTLRGTVVDESGRPAPDVWVTAKWTQQERYSTTRELATQTSETGEFVLHPVDKDAEISLRCDSADRASVEEATLPAGHTAPVQLMVSPDGLAAVAGQIVDDRGQPVANVQVSIRGSPRALGDRSLFSRLVGSTPELKNEWILVSDREGQFATPRPLPKLVPYRITVEAEGMVRYQTSFEPGSRDPEKSLGDIVLKRVLRIAGRVVDSEGRAVPQAAVSTHGKEQYGGMVSAVTDDEGRFTLEDAHPDARLLFVRKEGFRFRGTAVPQDAEAVAIAITQADEPPPGDPLSTRRLPNEKREKLLKDLLLSAYERQQDGASDYFRREILKLLLPQDRQLALDRLIDLKTEQARSEVLLSVGEVEDALQQAGEIGNAYSRTYALLAAANAVKEPAERQRILGEALVHARAVQNPAERLVVFGNIAERLIDAGEREAAESILTGALEPAAQLPTTGWAGFARGHFAETLALVDLDEALALVKELADEQARDRHFGNIAHELAGLNPEQAERVLQLVKPGYERDRYAKRICYRMAPVDLERARRLAADIQRSQFRAYTWGVMAMSVAEKDTATGRELLRQAFDEAEKSAAQAREQMFETAVVLVRFAETVDPEATAEYLWRAAALHPGPQLGFEYDGRQLDRDAHTAKLILLLALYDVEPDLTAALAEPIFKRVEHREPRAAYQAAPVYAALALVDPERAIAWHARFFKKVDAEQLRLISPPQAWRVIAGMLAPEADETWEFLQKEIFRIWVIDTEDF